VDQCGGGEKKRMRISWTRGTSKSWATGSVGGKLGEIGGVMVVEELRNRGATVTARDFLQLWSSKKCFPQEVPKKEGDRGVNPLKIPKSY
jgi:hypothetical protein